MKELFVLLARMVCEILRVLMQNLGIHAVNRLRRQNFAKKEDTTKDNLW